MWDGTIHNKTMTAGQRCPWGVCPYPEISTTIIYSVTSARLPSSLLPPLWRRIYIYIHIVIKPFYRLCVLFRNPEIATQFLCHLINSRYSRSNRYSEMEMSCQETVQTLCYVWGICRQRVDTISTCKCVIIAVSWFQIWSESNLAISSIFATFTDFCCPWCLEKLSISRWLRVLPEAGWLHQCEWCHTVTPGC